MSNYIEYNDKIVFILDTISKKSLKKVDFLIERFCKRLDTTKNLSDLVRGEQKLINRYSR